MTTELENLPALRGLARLADLRPTVIVDSREQEPFVFNGLPSRVAPLQGAQLEPHALTQSC